MAKQILNRRENVYTDGLPPEIASVDTLVTNTDFATTNKGGVIKTSAAYGTAMSAGGALYGSPRSEAQYSSSSTTLIMCKGTLENIIATLVKRELIALLGGKDTDVEGTDLSDWFAIKTADGWNVGAVKDTPTPP